MNFGNVGVMEMLFVLVVWAIPLTVLVWFVRTLTAMAASLREIADRLASLERSIRDRPLDR